MKEVGVPCSVITSNEEHGDSSHFRPSVLQETLCDQLYNTSVQNEQPNNLDGLDTTLLSPLMKNGNLEAWPESHALGSNELTESSERSQMSCRIRKQKRPYSPVQIEKKSIGKRVNSVKSNNTSATEEGTQSCEKPFVCGICSSPYVVNPARSHSSAKTYTPRRVFDPVSKKTLLVCNACKLAVSRSRKAKVVKKVPPPTKEMKIKFEEECAKFSLALVDQLKDSDASRLYCPVFTTHPCKCLQNYLTNPEEEEAIEEEQSIRSINLLNLLKEAKELSAQKNPISHVQYPRPAGLLRRKTQAFEEFVQEKRVYLRSHLKLCERACQRILFYSNNFLHKQLKSAPDQGSRIHQFGGSSGQPLCPIPKLPNESCCQDRCVLMALTHSRLLEDWRRMARRSQHDARRVLAEMLTPSGGSKANCYKFIKMVTGCSHTTIRLVNEQMFRTQGDREPPEHGLRRWWKQHAGRNTSEDAECVDTERKNSDADSDVDDPDEEKSQDTVPNGEEATDSRISDIHIPTAQELRELNPAEAGRRLLQQRQKLASVQQQLARQQRQLEVMQHQRPPIILGCCSGNTDLQPVQQTTVVQQPATVSTVTPQPQLVHILEIPATPASVIPNLPDANQQQPTVSVLSSSGEYEPISNISVNVAPGQPLGTVFFVPEYEAVPTIPTDHTSGRTNTVFTASATEGETTQIQHNLAAHAQSASSASSPQLQQPLALPPMQFHLPLDIPVQLTVQSSAEPAVQTAQQPPAQPTTQVDAPQSAQPLSSSQPLLYQVTPPVVSSSSAQHHITLQSTPTVVINVINEDGHYVQTSEPHIYYLETVNCVTSVPD